MDKLNLVIPQWQGGGQNLNTFHAAYALRDNYLGERPSVTVDIKTDDIAPVEHDVLGYRDILDDMDRVNAVLDAAQPKKIFTLGGGCDSDTPCSAYLNKQVAGDMAMVYIDAHGDLNLPEASESKLYYGMSLRALAGDSAPEIVSRLASHVEPRQLVMGANRNLDPEELRYKADEHVSDFTVAQIEADPACIAREVAAKGYGNVYIHIDFDSLDPNEFTLTPVPEPDGLRCATLAQVVREIAKVSNVIGFALLEYCGTKADTGNALLEELVEFGASI